MHMASVENRNLQEKHGLNSFGQETNQATVDKRVEKSLVLSLDLKDNRKPIECTSGQNSNALDQLVRMPGAQYSPVHGKNQNINGSNAMFACIRHEPGSEISQLIYG